MQTALRIEQIRLAYAMDEKTKEIIRNSIKELARDLLRRYRKEINVNP